MPNHDYTDDQFAPWGQVPSELFARVRDLLVEHEARYDAAGLLTGTQPGGHGIFNNAESFHKRYAFLVCALSDEDGPEDGPDAAQLGQEILEAEGRILWTCSNTGK